MHMPYIWPHMADAAPAHAGMPPSYEGGGPAMLPAAHNPGHSGVTTTDP